MVYVHLNNFGDMGSTIIRWSMSIKGIDRMTNLRSL